MSETEPKKRGFFSRLFDATRNRLPAPTPEAVTEQAVEPVEEPKPDVEETAPQPVAEAEAAAVEAPAAEPAAPPAPVEEAVLPVEPEPEPVVAVVPQPEPVAIPEPAPVPARSRSGAGGGD